MTSVIGLFAGFLNLAAVKQKQGAEPNASSSHPVDAADKKPAAPKIKSTANWLTLPPTPQLPEPRQSGTKSINGVPLYFAVFGQGDPVLMLHGGLGSSDYWGHQVELLADNYSVIVMDTRGHGRSPLESRIFSYKDFAEDACALLQSLDIASAAIIGWSDGAITGLHIAVHKPQFVNRLFAFGANSNLSGLKPGGSKSPVFAQYTARTKLEYQRLSPRPEQWPALSSGLAAMWKTEPNFSKKELGDIKVPVTISDGEHDEIIRLAHNKEISDSIPKSRLLIQRDVSHFAMLQSPGTFTGALLEFMLE